MNIGEQIKALRKKNNLTQEGLSELLCVSCLSSCVQVGVRRFLPGSLADSRAYKIVSCYSR